MGSRLNGKASLAALRMAGVALIGGLLLAQGGCGGGLSGTSGEVNQSLAAQPATQTLPVAIAVPRGIPAAKAGQVSEAMTAALRAKSVPVVATNGTQQFTVRGYFAAAPDPAGTKVSFIWDVTDKTNKRVKRIEGNEVFPGIKSADIWNALDAGSAGKLSARAADEIAAWLPSQQQPTPVAGASTPPSDQSAPRASAAAAAPSPAASSAPPPAAAARAPAPPSVPPASTATTTAPATTASTTSAAAPAARGPMIASVEAVACSAGDCALSLTAAMRRQLASQGIQLAESGATYTVRGTVELGAAEEGKQPVTIRWTVVDKAGNKLEKTVVQRNKVDEGSLDGAWGQVADMAAGEAAKSVARIISGATS